MSNERTVLEAAETPISIPNSESDSHKIWWSNVVVKKPKNVFTKRKWNSIDVGNLCAIIVLHALALFAPFTFSWGSVTLAAVTYFVTGCLGVTLSYHRNLTHRSFKLPKWLEYIFAYCGVLALQGDPIGWVSTHRYHHQFCDSEKDPHTPTKGFWFSHINWAFDTNSIFEKSAGLSSECMEPSSSLDNSKSSSISRLPLAVDPPFSLSSFGLPQCGETVNVQDLENQPFYRFIRSTYILHGILFGLLLYAFGGFSYLVWGLGVSSVLMHHSTFMVNSVCHIWGNQTWNTGDLSKNNWWVALLSFGEGWHNNHHAFPYSARHGLEWWQVDMTWYIVKLLQILGLATHVKLPSMAHKERFTLKSEAI
ncbi:unnamed protein product [Amaranthus hypochondriacus]